jgi:hypothetical protein
MPPVVALNEWVWLGRLDEEIVVVAEPPVAPATYVEPSALIGIRPVPYATHVPNPKSVAGLVATVLMYIDPTGYAACKPVVTKAVVAIWVVFVPEAAVGAVGVPVNTGETI